MDEDAIRDNGWALPESEQVRSPQQGESGSAPMLLVVPDPEPPADPSKRPDVAVDKAREPYWRVLKCVVGAAVLLATVVAISSSRQQAASPTSYTVVPGSQGSGRVLALPDDIGSLEYVTPDGSPFWKQYPRLLPASRSDSFGTVTGSYLDASGKTLFNVDVVYTTGSGANRAVFSLGPASLLTLVVGTLFVTDLRQYPSGSDGSVLACGTYAVSPLCVWADKSTLVIVDDYDTSGSATDLAGTTREIRSAIED